MITPFSGRRRLTPGLDPSEKRKLWFFAVLFVLVLAIFLVAQIWPRMVGQAEKPGGGARSSGPLKVGVAGRETEDGRSIFKLKPPSPEEKRAMAEDDLQSMLGEFVAKGKLMDSRDTDDSDVLAKLLDQAVWNYRITSIPDLHYRRLREGDTEHDPDRDRGRLVSAFGKLVEISEPEPFPDRVKGVEKLYRAVLVTAEGRYYRILRTTPIGHRPGDWIQVYGIFYRTRPYTPPGGKPVTSFCLVLTREIGKAYPPVRITKIDPAWAKEVKEASFDEAHRIDERPFWLLMNYVKTMGLDGYRKRRAAGEFPFEDCGALAKRLADLPGDFRFRFVAAEGRITAPFVDVLETDNPGKIKRLDSAFLVQREYLVRLVSPRPWSRYGFRVGEDYVRVEGIFYKKWKYVPRNRDEAYEIPLIIVTDVKPIDISSRDWGQLLQWVFGGAAAVLVVVFFFLAFRDRKQVADFRRRYRRDKEGRRNARRGGGGEESREES